MDMERETITAEELDSSGGLYKIYDIRKNPDDDQIPGSVAFSGWELEFGGEPPFSRDENVVLYCGGGNTCLRVAEQLRRQGFRTVALEGGFKGWVEAGLPLEPRLL